MKLIKEDCEFYKFGSWGRSCRILHMPTGIMVESEANDARFYYPENRTNALQLLAEKVNGSEGKVLANKLSVDDLGDMISDMWQTNGLAERIHKAIYGGSDEQ